MSDDPTCMCCCRALSEHNTKRQCPETSYFIAHIATPSVDGEGLARRFHEAYERLAPAHGYETRRETREFDPASANGRLMIAVCTELAASLSPRPLPTREEVARTLCLSCGDDPDREGPWQEWWQESGYAENADAIFALLNGEAQS